MKISAMNLNDLVHLTAPAEPRKRWSLLAVLDFFPDTGALRVPIHNRIGILSHRVLQIPIATREDLELLPNAKIEALTGM